MIANNRRDGKINDEAGKSFFVETRREMAKPKGARCWLTEPIIIGELNFTI
jgi:hypothetical protein